MAKITHSLIKPGVPFSQFPNEMSFNSDGKKTQNKVAGVVSIVLAFVALGTWFYCRNRKKHNRIEDKESSVGVTANKVPSPETPDKKETRVATPSTIDRSPPPSLADCVGQQEMGTAFPTDVQGASGAQSSPSSECEEVFNPMDRAGADSDGSCSTPPPASLDRTLTPDSAYGDGGIHEGSVTRSSPLSRHFR